MTRKRTRRQRDGEPILSREELDLFQEDWLVFTPRERLARSWALRAPARSAGRSRCEAFSKALRRRRFVTSSSAARRRSSTAPRRSPRTSTGFSAAARRAVRFDTAWGIIPVVAFQELAEMKKTRRLADYDVISDLALIRLRTTN